MERGRIKGAQQRQICGREARRQGQQKRCEMMGSEAVDTQEENIGHIGREIVDGVLVSGTSTAASMDLYPSPAEERPTKKRPAHRIRHGTAEALTVS